MKHWIKCIIVVWYPEIANCEVSHEAGPVGRVGEVLWVDGDGDVVHRQDDYERYPHGPRQGSVYDLKWNIHVMNSKSHVESPIM